MAAIGGVGGVDGGGAADASDPAGAALASPELAGDATLGAVAAGTETLGPGSRGAPVRAVQAALVKLGSKIAADGAFGPATRAAVIAFQTKAGLPPSGTVDAATIAALDGRLLDGPDDFKDDPYGDDAPTADPAPARTPTPYDTDWFTDADSLPTPDVPAPAPDPARPPRTVDSVGAPPATPAPDPSGSRAALRGEVRAALAGDAPALAAFDRLASSGRLDRNPATLVNLAAMAQQSAGPAGLVPQTMGRDPRLIESGIAPEILLSQVVRALDDPLRVQQGKDHATCGAGTMEYMLLREDPAEFVRLVDGLTRPGGSVALRSGASLEVPATAIARDASGRTDVDRLLQSAFMERASGMGWLFDYDNTQDDGSAWEQLLGNGGETVTGFTSLWNDVTGARHHAVDAYDADEAAAIGAQLAAAAARGEPVSVEMRFPGATDLHFLTLEKVNLGPDGKPATVYLRNPWGKDSASGEPPRWALPEGGGRIGMKWGDFLAYLDGATLDG
jgi:hypothetical protein